MEISRRKGDSRKITMSLMAAIMAISTTIGCVSGELHRVGDTQGWRPNVNYTEWARGERFYVDDWLLFVFDKNMYNVLEVNKTSYQNCNEQGFITNITKGGRDVFHLTEARPYYFLSGRGFCWGGMKLAILVQNHPLPPAPTPTSTTNGSPSTTAGHMLLTLAITTFLVLVGVWNYI